MANTASPAKKAEKPRSFTALAAIIAALALAIAIVINLMASRLNVVWDMTPTGMYKLTDTSKDMLKSLDKEVNFYFLLDMDLLSTDTNSMALYHALKEYASYDKINFVSFETDNDPALTQKLMDYGFQLTRGDIVIECDGKAKHIPGKNMYQSYLNTDESGATSLDSMYFAGENYISGAIDAVAHERDSVIYFVTGHGEKSLSSDYTTLAKNLANRNYLTQSLDLASEGTVPENASMLIFAAPKTDLTKDELRILNEYLDKGGNVCFWMSPNEDEYKYSNIESVLEDFGLRMDYDIVAETDSSLHVSGDPYTFRCSVVKQEDDSDNNITAGLSDIIDSGIIPFMSRSRSFYRILSPKDTSLEVGSLLQTTATGSDSLGNAVSTAVGEPCGGTDPTNQKITEQVLDLAMYSTSSLRSGAKVMVMGNAEFIDDTNVAQDFMIVPVNLMLSVYSWMYDSDLALDMGIANKERTYDTLRLNSEKTANTTNVIFVVVPVAVGLIGLGDWLKRRYS